MSHADVAQDEKPNISLLIRGALWIAIGALIAAAIVCVIWVLVGDQDGLIGRAFLTILLLAAFAGIAILEAGLAPNRPDWLALASMITWIVALLVGAVKIWLPFESEYFGSGGERFFQLLLVVGILQLALVHVRLFTKAAQRHVTTFTRVIYLVTLAFLVALAGMLIFFLTFPETVEYTELYWRIVVALTILVAVGTTLIPLLNALFAPRKQRPAAVAPVMQQWPTYADGVTPVPALMDGTPDWNAYYTGQPTHPQGRFAQQPYGQAQIAQNQYQQATVAPAQPVLDPYVPPVPAPASPAPAAPAPASAPAPAAPAPAAPASETVQPSPEDPPAQPAHEAAGAQSAPSAPQPSGAPASEPAPQAPAAPDAPVAPASEPASASGPASASEPAPPAPASEPAPPAPGATQTRGAFPPPPPAPRPRGE